MKRLISLLLCLVFVLSVFAACGGEVTPPDTTDASDAETTEPNVTDQNTTEPDETKAPDVVEETPVTENAYIMKMKNGAKGVVTIVHDDGTLNTVAFLDKEFEEHNLRGTIGMIATRVISTEGVKNNTQIKLWQNYLDTGRFDIACHSYTHKFWGLTDKAESGVYINNSGVETPFNFGDGNITFETKGARDALRECFPDQRILSFIHPGFGKYIDENGKTIKVSDTAWKIIKANFIGSRGGGTSTQSWSTNSYYQLTSFQVSLKHDLSQWTAQVDSAARYGKWIIFMFHDILPDSSITASTSTLKVKQSTASGLMEHIGAKVAKGELWCAFFEEGLLYAQEVKATKGTVTTYSDKIEISISHNLDIDTFNYPLTVRAKVPADWTSVVLTHADGTTETLTPFVEGENTYVYANVVPNGQVAVLTNAN